MKHKSFLFLTMLLVGASLAGHAQTIFGVWQVASKHTGEGLMENYVFNVDNTFEYRTDSDDGLRRVIALGGTYTFAKDVLKLEITYTREVVGGTIERSRVTSGNDFWAIEGGTVQKKALAKSVSQTLAAHLNTQTVLAIEENQFYRVLK